MVSGARLGLHPNRVSVDRARQINTFAQATVQCSCSMTNRQYEDFLEITTEEPESLNPCSTLSGRRRLSNTSCVQSRELRLVKAELSPPTSHQVSLRVFIAWIYLFGVQPVLLGMVALFPAQTPRLAKDIRILEHKFAKSICSCKAVLHHVRSPSEAEVFRPMHDSIAV